MTGLLDRMSLRARLLAILAVAIVVALAATGYGVQAVLKQYLVAQVDKQLAEEHKASADDLEYLRRIIDADARGPGRRGLGPTNYAFYLYVDGQDAGETAAGGSSAELPAFEPVTSAEAIERDGRPFTVPAGPDGALWRGVAVPVPFTTGDGSVTIALPLEGAEEAVAQLRLLMFVIGALAIALCTALGWVAIRRAFVPLAEVEETAAAIAAGDLSRRVPERPATTEVGRLTASLNGMLTQIESAFRAREASEARTRRFAADASHELRTPLASIRGFAELFRQGAVAHDDVPRAMQRIEDEATRMGVLVEDLLLLARLDEQRPDRTDPVDLAVLAGDAVHDARGLDATRRVTLTGLRPGVGPAQAVVMGDENRLRQVVANLVANAVRHTPAGSPVEVAVGMDDVDGSDGSDRAERAERSERADRARRAVLEVRDHGPGLTPEQAERIFERFYRLDASRQRGQGGGSGLGLSIVGAVVGAHGGDVSVVPTPGGGATFRVALPVRQGADADVAELTS